MANPTFRALTLAAQAAATVNGTDLENMSARGAVFVIDITAISGTNTTATFTVEGKDRSSGKYYTILASTALNGTGTTVLRVYPGLTAAANLTVNDVLPGAFRVKAVVAADANPSVTATVGASLIG